MILWLASYPKSGNTLLRSLLSTYFYTKDGIFDFELLKKIIENKKKISFLKTHSSFFRANNHRFTNLQNSLGAVYVVRDPRKVVVSYANHFRMNIDESTNTLLNDAGIYERNTRLKTFCGKWNFNYSSWKKFNAQKLFLIKYEDLIKDKENILKEILLFLNKLIQNKFEINQAKIKNIISSTSFEKMKDLEQKKIFPEATKNKKTDKEIHFFYLGDQKKSEKLLDKKNKDKIE